MVSGFPNMRLNCSTRFFGERGSGSWRFRRPANGSRNVNIASHGHCPVPARLRSDNGWRTKKLCGGPSPAVRGRRMHLMFRRMTLAKQKRARTCRSLSLLLAHLESIGPFSAAAAFALAQARPLSDRNLKACSWLIVHPEVLDVRLVFAHRAFCASEIFLRAAAERVRFGLFGFACIPVRRRPTKLPIT